MHHSNLIIGVGFLINGRSIPLTLVFLTTVPRVYFVELLRCEMLDNFAKKDAEVLRCFTQTKLQQVQLDAEDFRTFLANCGEPIEVNSLKAMQSMRSVKSDVGCNCGVRSLCKLHMRKCSTCRKDGNDAMKCIWRRGPKKSLKSLPFLGLPSKMSK